MREIVTRMQQMHLIRLAVMLLCLVTLVMGQPGIASAAETNVAGLIVDYGDGRVTWVWVPFAEDEISGVELLERSGLDIVTVGFGGMGEAVCQVEATGCSVDDCQTRLCQTSDPESPFWRYSRQSDDGEWALAATGASGAKVRDGDVDAWAWTGDDVELPAVTIDEIARRTGADSASLDDATSVPDAKSVTSGESENENSTDDLPQQIAGAVAIVVLAGGAIWWVRHRRAAP